MKYLLMEDKIWMYKNNKKLINKIKIKLENERRIKHE